MTLEWRTRRCSRVVIAELRSSAIVARSRSGFALRLPDDRGQCDGRADPEHAGHSDNADGGSPTAFPPTSVMRRRVNDRCVTTRCASSRRAKKKTSSRHDPNHLHCGVYDAVAAALSLRYEAKRTDHGEYLVWLKRALDRLERARQHRRLASPWPERATIWPMEAKPPPNAVLHYIRGVAGLSLEEIWRPPRMTFGEAPSSTSDETICIKSYSSEAVSTSEPCTGVAHYTKH
jgi:hypothetical protein